MTRSSLGKNRVSLVDSIYKFQWVVAYGGHPKEHIDWLCKKIEIDYRSDIPEDARIYGHFFAYRPLKNGLIWFKEKYPAACTVAHECYHATMYLFETMKEDGPVEKNEEFFAYYLEWLVHNCYFAKARKR